jgi:hypothetical protein
MTKSLSVNIPPWIQERLGAPEKHERTNQHDSSFDHGSFARAAPFRSIAETKSMFAEYVADPFDTFVSEVWNSLQICVRQLDQFTHVQHAGLLKPIDRSQI